MILEPSLEWPWRAVKWRRETFPVGRSSSTFSGPCCPRENPYCLDWVAWQALKRDIIGGLMIRRISVSHLDSDYNAIVTGKEFEMLQDMVNTLRRNQFMARRHGWQHWGVNGVGTSSSYTQRFIHKIFSPSLRDFLLCLVFNIQRRNASIKGFNIIPLN